MLKVSFRLVPDLHLDMLIGLSMEEQDLAAKRSIFES